MRPSHLLVGFFVFVFFLQRLKGGPWPAVAEAISVSLGRGPWAGLWLLPPRTVFPAPGTHLVYTDSPLQLLNARFLS